MRRLEDLAESITGGRERAHAYIIEGRAGVTRDSFVNDLIEGIGCRELDVVYMNRSGKTGYVKEDVLPFMERLSMNPYGRYLAGVINDAELLSETLQNKLLKTLEEPQENVLIFLTSSRSDELLRTVRSRCALVRMGEFEGYPDEEDGADTDELMPGVLMLLTHKSAFHEFREFLDKHIKTTEDALQFIALAEDRLRESMAEGRAAGLCADMIENAERSAMDIIKGMDKNKALRRMYLELCSREDHRV